MSQELEIPEGFSSLDEYFSDKYKDLKSTAEVDATLEDAQGMSWEERQYLQGLYDKLMADVISRNEGLDEDYQKSLDHLKNFEKLFVHRKTRRVLTYENHIKGTENRKIPNIFESFIHTEWDETGLIKSFFYEDTVTRTPQRNERCSVFRDKFYADNQVIGRRWMIGNTPHFQLYPDAPVRSYGAKDINNLRRVCYRYYPKTTTVIPPFLINWSQEMDRRGSTFESPKFIYEVIKGGAFMTQVYLPAAVSSGCLPEIHQNSVEYHIIKIEGKHFIYLEQTQERDTTVLIYIPDEFHTMFDSPQELFYALTHPEGLDWTEPHFRQGEWYLVPTDMLTRELIKPLETPKPFKSTDGRVDGLPYYPLEPDSDHYVTEYRFDADGDAYVRGTLYHASGDHPAIRLCKKIWHKVFKSKAEGHSADMRGATVRYD